MIVQRRSVLFVLLITGLFSFGCGKAFEPTGDSTLASMCTVNPQALKKGAISFSSPFNHNKVQISESDSAQIMSLDKKLKAHTEYVALIDNECVNDSLESTAKKSYWLQEKEPIDFVCRLIAFS